MTDLATQNVTPILGRGRLAFIPEDGRFLHNQDALWEQKLSTTEDATRYCHKFVFHLFNTASVRGAL